MSTEITRGPNVCPSCGEANPPTDGYCRLCATALGAAIQKTQPPAQAPFLFPSTGIWSLKHNRVQRLYETVFAAGLVVTPLCIGLAYLFCLGALPMSPTLVVLLWVAVVGPFVVVCLTLRCLSRWWALRWPQFISRSRYIWVHHSAGLLCMATMAYGIYWWPAEPKVQPDGTYVDKFGKLYTHAEFDSFERWAGALHCVFLPFAILSVVGNPVPPWPASRRTASDQSAEATQP